MLRSGVGLLAATAAWSTIPLLPPGRASADPVATGGETLVAGTSRGDDDGWARSEPLEAAAAFAMVGVLAPPGAPVQVRTAEHDQEWSAWQDAPRLHRDEGPDVDEGGRDAAEATALLWVGSATRLQLRVRGAAAEELEAHLVHAEETETAGLGPMGASMAHASERPAIVTRAQWGADESWRSGSPRTGSDLRGAAIHHTVTGNGYSAGDAASVVRGIYRYHTQSLGWADIGYNFLVDRFGTIYEGRAGGIDDHVIGAHAGGFNAQTFGVALLGTHGGTAPSRDALDAAAELIAWKAAIHGLDPAATVQLESNGSSRYSSGTQISVPGVCGHRDLSATSCPGDAAFAEVPGVRRTAAARTDAYLSGPPLARLAGADAIATGVAVSQAAFADGQAERAVVATDQVFADAAVAGPLAGSQGPVLLTAPDALDERVADELARALPQGATVHLLGGEGALSPAVEEALAERWSVQRLPGATRVETAALAAREVIERSGRREALIARSGPDDAWADALAAGAWGAHAGVPLLLTDTEALDADTAAVLDDLAIDRTYVCGGKAAVAPAVLDALPDPERIAGDERAATATAIAERLWESTEEVLLTGGYRASAWKDALAAAPLAARRSAPVLLVHHERFPEATGSYLADLALGDAERATLIGGEAAVSEQVSRQAGTVIAGS